MRHGETALNAAGVLRGQLDVPLNATGEAEAVALGEVFRGVPLSAVVSSPLRRAAGTASRVASASGALVTIDDRLRDRFYGEWAGHSLEQVEGLFGSIDSAPFVEALKPPLRNPPPRPPNTSPRMSFRSTPSNWAPPPKMMPSCLPSELPLTRISVGNSSAENAAPAVFLERLPVRLRGSELYAVEAQDHYLRLHTSKGADLILMRLSDAIDDALDDPLDHTRVHRRGIEIVTGDLAGDLGDFTAR